MQETSWASLVETNLFRVEAMNDIYGHKTTVSYYRQCILQQRIPDTFFYGKPGIGKTSFANAIINDFKSHVMSESDIESSDESLSMPFKKNIHGIESILINASLHRTIPEMEEKISSFLNHCKYNAKLNECIVKIIIIDEIDNCTLPCQYWLLDIMQSMNKNYYAGEMASFILTCNENEKVLHDFSDHCVTFDQNIANATSHLHMHEWVLENLKKFCLAHFDFQIIDNELIDILQAFCTANKHDLRKITLSCKKMVANILNAKDFDPSVFQSELYKRLEQSIADFGEMNVDGYANIIYGSMIDESVSDLDFMNIVAKHVECRDPVMKFYARNDTTIGIKTRPLMNRLHDIIINNLDLTENREDDARFIICDCVLEWKAKIAKLPEIPSELLLKNILGLRVALLKIVRQ